MELKSVSIQNFKGIRNIDIAFQAGFNLLIGDNGVGKTSVLEAISVGLGGFLASVDGIATKHISQDEVRLETELTGDGSVNIRQTYPVKISCTAQLNDKQYDWIRQKKTKQSRTTVEPRDISRQSKEMLDAPESILPVLNYQSAARMWAQKREKATNPFQERYTRSVGYIDCLAEESNSKLLLNWCKRMEEISWQEDKKIAEYEAVKTAVATFMSRMCGREVKGVRYHKRTEELAYWLTEEENLPVRLLSAGYQSIIWMVMDISYRMAVLNPNLRLEVTKKTPGIVLIDEIDLHLHPKWQWNIVQALKETFPRVQFIATTHSPLILASCKNERLITLENGEAVRYDKSAYGYEVSDVLSLFQGSYARSRKIKEKFDAFYERIDSEKYDAAKSILEDLLRELNETDPDIVKAKITLELETSMLGE